MPDLQPRMGCKVASGGGTPPAPALDWLCWGEDDDSAVRRCRPMQVPPPDGVRASAINLTAIAISAKPAVDNGGSRARRWLRAACWLASSRGCAAHPPAFAPGSRTPFGAAATLANPHPMIPWPCRPQSGAPTSSFSRTITPSSAPPPRRSAGAAALCSTAPHNLQHSRRQSGAPPMHATTAACACIRPAPPPGGLSGAPPAELQAPNTLPPFLSLPHVMLPPFWQPELIMREGIGLGFCSAPTDPTACLIDDNGVMPLGRICGRVGRQKT